jgi:hypothetical protein
MFWNVDLCPSSGEGVEDTCSVGSVRKTSEKGVVIDVSSF